MNKIINNTIQIGAFTIDLTSILKLILFAFSIYLALNFLKRIIYKSNKIDEPKKYSIFNLLKYFVFVLSFLTGLQIIGFDLSVLIAGSAALLVGVGLGLQNLFSNFISGIIILFDSTVKVNDVIEINGMVSVVQEINLRTTTVLTRDDKYILLPNSILTSNQLINWTHSNISSRFEVTVGVDYSSDVNHVMQLLLEAVVDQPGVQKEPKPFVRFINFGESSLDFSVHFWSEDVFRIKNVESDIRVKIMNTFKEHNISIPFPQRVVHTKS